MAAQRPIAVMSDSRIDPDFIDSVDIDDEDPPDPLIGQLVADKFRVEELLGEGGMGRVYKAHQEGLARPIALKMLHRHTATRPGMKERFQREARAASMLQHPNSVVVYDFGQWEGQLFIAMEFLEGRDLGEIIDDDGALPLERARAIMDQLLSVLVAAHGQDLLHRDLKPDNIVVLRDPRVAAGDSASADYIKVVDFGLARVMDPESDMRLTKDGGVSGTPAYMAPEQARGEELDARADLYAAGVIFYEMMTGLPPFDGDNSLDVMLKHQYSAAPSPARQAPNQRIPAALDTACLRALEKRPEDRFASAAEFRQALMVEVVPHTLNVPAAPEFKKLDRNERASAVGLSDVGEVRPQRHEGANAETRLLVVQAAKSFVDSPAAVLGTAGFDVKAVSFAEISERLSDRDALVIDLRPDAATTLTAVEKAMGTWPLEWRPLILVGPEDDFDIMQRALTAGVSDYVPVAKLPRLPKIARRAIKRHRRKRK